MGSKHRLQVGVDFGKNKADFAMLAPEGEPLEMHRSFVNSVQGYEQARAMLLETLARHSFQGLDIAAEATSYYWLPLYIQLWQDKQLTDAAQCRLGALVQEEHAFRSQIGLP